jgi:hypothetical protein
MHHHWCSICGDLIAVVSRPSCTRRKDHDLFVGAVDLAALRLRCDACNKEIRRYRPSS